MRAFASIAAVALLAFSACGPGGGDDGDDEDPDAFIIVTPGDVVLTVINGAEVTQGYTAILRHPDGDQDEDITADVVWSIPETSVGYFSGTTLHANGAGRGTVTATLAAKVGTANVEVYRRDVRVGDGVPPTVPDLFDAATDDPARLATIVYPSDGTIVPPNLGDFDVHWRDTTGSDVYEITIQTYYAEVHVYTLDPAAPTGAWLAFLENEWTTVAHSEIGATLSVTVRGLTQATPAMSSHAQITVLTSREDMNGGIYYWAAASASGAPEGIYRHDMNRPGEAAEQFFTTVEAGRCVACHVLSRDGTKMAVTYDGGDQSATVLDVATRTPSIPVATQYWNFATFTPDAAQLLTARQGALQLRDPANGTVQTTVPTSGYSTHPDISADGTRIVYVRPNAPSVDWQFNGGQLVTQTFNQAAQTFGGEVPLVTSSDNNYYPSFSPDGQWVLFNRASEAAYNAGTAELWVVKTDGTVGPIKLSAANIGAGLTNSWARWAPFEGSFGEDEEPIYWLTWSSKRAFGVRLAAGRPQIWMTPFFPERAAASADPTAPGFRLPFQDIQTSNHIAQWTTQVVPIE